MFEFTLASLLFHVAAGTALLLLASGAAAADLHYRSPARRNALDSHDAGTVVNLPAPRAPKLPSRVELEAQSEAA
jgi:hypothetical protein